jgi:hypothetical protein
MDKYVAPPKEAQRNLLGDVLLVRVTSMPVVNGKVAYKGARGVVELLGLYPGAIDHKRDGVGCVELLALGLGAVANNEPAPEPVRATKLLDLHVGTWLTVRGIPLVGSWANGKFELLHWWGWCVGGVGGFTWSWYELWCLSFRKARWVVSGGFTWWNGSRWWHVVFVVVCPSWRWCLLWSWYSAP